MLLGAFGLLAWSPYNLLDPGFQLSFAAVAAIFVAVPRLERLLDGYPFRARSAAVLALSTACAVATAPILWLQFGSIPVLSVSRTAWESLLWRRSSGSAWRRPPSIRCFLTLRRPRLG